MFRRYPLNNPGRYIASQDASEGCCRVRLVIRSAKDADYAVFHGRLR